MVKSLGTAYAEEKRDLAEEIRQLRAQVQLAHSAAFGQSAYHGLLTGMLGPVGQPFPYAQKAWRNEPDLELDRALEREIARMGESASGAFREYLRSVRLVFARFRTLESLKLSLSERGKVREAALELADACAKLAQQAEQS